MKRLASKIQKKVCFALAAKPGSQVYVAGTFNNWSPSANPLKDNPDSGLFKTAMQVSKGHHEYKFVVDGIWTGDPECRVVIPNSFGSHNSVIHVE